VFRELFTKNFWPVWVFAIVVMGGVVGGSVYFLTSSEGFSISGDRLINDQLPIISRETVEIEPVNRDFAILAPQINLNAPVKEGVDGTNEYEYLPRVLQGVAHYKRKDLGEVVVDGALPGQGSGNIFLFGHSQIPGGDTSNYQGVFNDLEELKPGEIVTLYYQGEEYKYQVKDGRVVDKTAVEYLAHTETETLTLMSCWPLGLDWKRYVVRAERVL